MIGLTLPKPTTKPFHVLCLGARCDDIEIGCGATLLSLIRQNPEVHIHWHVFTSTAERKIEAQLSAELFCENAAKLDLEIRSFKDGFLPYEGAAVKTAMEEIKHAIEPDLIFTHYRHDMHQDHRKISELTWNSFRNHLILEYEIPKWDGDLGTPNTYTEISQETVNQKIAKLQQAYNSQQTKRWFTDDLFWSLMRIRGMECNSPSLLAEGFYARKIQLNLPSASRTSE